VRLELCIHLTLGLSLTNLITNGEEWKEIHAVIETRVLDKTHVFFTPTVVASLRGSTHAVQVDFILLNNRQYLPGVAWRY
jgi:hypothetical protein